MEMSFGPLRRTFPPQYGDGCRADLTLDDGRLFVINMTEEGVIMDLFDGPEDGDPKTIGMTYDEWAEFVDTEGNR